MKKMMAIMMALAMLLCGMSLAEAAAEGADLLGTWYINSALYNGVPISPADLGLEMVLVFEENGAGSAAVTYPGEEPQTMDMAWAIDGDAVSIALQGDAPQEGLFDGESITIDVSGISMIFTREAPVATELPEAVEADSEEAFFGDWVAYKVGIMGTVFDPSNIDMNITLHVEAGKVRLGVNDDAIDFQTVFENGALTVNDVTGTMNTVRLSADGNLQLMLISAGTETLVYLMPAEA